MKISLLTDILWKLSQIIIKFFKLLPIVTKFSPTQGKAGTEVTISGTNLQGAKVFFGDVEAVVSSSTSDQVTVIVPDMPGEQTVKISKDSFSVEAPQKFIVLSSKAFTFRGDITFHKSSILSSVNPSSRELDYLVLMVLPKDLVLPPGADATNLKANLNNKLDKANDFWQEASYKKRPPFTFDIKSSTFDLPRTAKEYYNATNTTIESAAFTYPLTFVGGETLELKGDNGFAVTVTFTAGKKHIDLVAGPTGEINTAIANAAAGNEAPIYATFNGVEGSTTDFKIILRSIVSGPDSTLDITGGTGLQLLGLDPEHATKTKGADYIYKDYLLIQDALESFVKSQTDDIAKSTIGSYNGVIVANVSNLPWETFRACAQTCQVNLRENKLAFELSYIAIATGYNWDVFAHEMGHNLGFPDLYDEAGGVELTGTEPGKWDIMCWNGDAHPTTWIKNYCTVDPDHPENTWVPDKEVVDLDPASDTAPSSVEALLIPYESPFPSTNPYAGSHPGIPLTRVIRINVGSNRKLFVENRQPGSFNDSHYGTVSFSTTVPMPTGGVIVTDAIDINPDSGQIRANVTMASPYWETLDTLNEEKIVLQVSPVSGIKVKIMEVIGTNRPFVYKVKVTWEAGKYFDPYIRKWNPPPYDSQDIWVDTNVDNNWDEYSQSDVAQNPEVLGNPVLNGDRLRVGWPSKIYARIHNAGNQAVNSVEVEFFKVEPPAVGNASPTSIGKDVVNLPEGGYALAKIDWTPTISEHVCIRAVIKPKTGELTPDNNEAQENFTNWYIEAASPYQRVTFPFQVVNPLPRRAQIRMQARGLKPGWFLDVDPAEFWLNAGQTKNGVAIIRADETVPFEDLSSPFGTPRISLVGLVLCKDRWVPFGGISGTAHAVKAAEIKGVVTPSGLNAVKIAGTATTKGEQVVPVGNTNVTVRVTDSTEAEILLTYTNTDANGNIQVFVPKPQGLPDTDDCMVELLLSPSPGVGPAETQLRFRFPSPPPKANFIAEPQNGAAPLTVKFTDTSTGTISTRSWNFTDGSSSSAANPSHTFNVSGQYLVKLSVTGPGGQDTKTRNIVVTPPVVPLKANFTAYPQQGTAPLSVKFTNTSTGNITSYSWDFGDQYSSNDPSPNHTFENWGVFQVTLKVSGSTGDDSKSAWVTVKQPVVGSGVVNEDI
ncbi:MAG: PKD domain-containing protein [Pseudomonadota bacterium]